MSNSPTEGREAWRLVVSAPENEEVFRPYRRASDEPRSLFDAIGVDLGHNSAEVRARGFSALTVAMPELTHILYERETAQPGWRDTSGRDQRLVNQGIDLLTYLYVHMVKEARFDASSGHDPRPLVRRIARNWRKDEMRSRSHEVPFDSGSADQHHYIDASLRDSSPSVESQALESVNFSTFRQELLAWGFLDERELDLFYAVYGQDQPLSEAAGRLGVPTPTAARKIISRVRAKAASLRDTILAWTTIWMVPPWMVPPKSGCTPSTILDAWGWSERANRSIDLGKPIEVRTEPIPRVADTVRFSELPDGCIDPFSGRRDFRLDGGPGVLIPLTRNVGGSSSNLFLLLARNFSKDPRSIENITPSFYVDGIKTDVAVGRLFFERLTGISSLDKELMRFQDDGLETWIITGFKKWLMTSIKYREIPLAVPSITSIDEF